MADLVSQHLLSLLILLSFLALPSQCQTTSFKCSSPGKKCMAIAGYKTPNATTVSNIATLFGIKDHNSILGMNNLPFSTQPSNHTFEANSTLKVPFTCSCTASNNGVSDNKLPRYKVKPQDGLYHIAAEVFSGLVMFKDIQKANNIPDPDKIEVGQEFWIPLPCSCDDVDEKKVVHYTHVVAPGSTLDAIAKEFGTEEDELKKLNGIVPPRILKAGEALDVPLAACKSMLKHNSIDSTLRLPNGTYMLTANNCVKCSCGSSTNMTLQCEPSKLKPSNWSVCPSMSCAGANNLRLGNTTATDSCGQTCAYAGYTKDSIMTEPANVSCPTSANKAPKSGFQNFSWTILFISLHMVWLCLHLFQ